MEAPDYALFGLHSPEVLQGQLAAAVVLLCWRVVARHLARTTASPGQQHHHKGTTSQHHQYTQHHSSALWARVVFRAGVGMQRAYQCTVYGGYQLGATRVVVVVVVAALAISGGAKLSGSSAPTQARTASLRSQQHCFF